MKIGNYELYENACHIVEGNIIVESVTFINEREIKATGNLDHIAEMIGLLRDIGVYIGKIEQHHVILGLLATAGCRILSINEQVIKFRGYRQFNAKNPTIRIEKLR